MKANPDRYSSAPVDRPEYLHTRYKRLVLVTNQSQFDTIDADDTDTLAVSCDWILAKQAVAQHRHCVHYELGLLDWEPADELDTGLFVRANDWMYDGNADLTLFDGVSLGAMFNQYGAICLIDFHRMHRSITRLIEMFSPDEIHFHDFMNDVNILSRDLRVKLVRDAADKAGVTFFDMAADAVHRTSVIEAEAQAEPLSRKALRWLYMRGMGALSSLSGLLHGKRRRVLIMVNTNMSEPLIRNFDGRGVEPVLRVETPPKKFGILSHCIATGIRLVTLSRPELNDADRKRIAEIKDALRANLDAPGSDAVKFLRAAYLCDIIDTGKLDGAARDCKAADRDLDRIRPERLVIDTYRGQPVRAYAEYARRKGIAVDYIWHSPMTPQNFVFDALDGDPRAKPLVTRNLSWGPVNEQWLDEIGAKTESVRVGPPWGGRYEKCQSVTSLDKDSNILILQYTPNVCDLKGLNSNMYSAFIELVRTLRGLGFNNIRYKLHPGPGRWGTGYFEKIREAFDIDVVVQKNVPYADCLAWADIVIGPFLTGAKFETLMAGRPYFAMLLPPNRTYPDFYPGYPVYRSIAEVANVIENYHGETLDAGEALINGVCSSDEIPNGAKKFWEALQ